MCGICGIKGLSVEQRNRLMPDMLGVLHHRGPDETGSYSDRDISLGIKRLSIIDLDTGSQPIFNEDKSIGVICNGEIYNFHILRDKLISKGHTFYTKSDVEALVHLYEEYETDCLNYIKGMFSFALWDKKKDTLFLARDRFGIKPLYYYNKNGVFAFASEPKALLKLPFVNKVLNKVALNLYFSLEYVPSPHSIFQDIFKLRPAHFLLYKHDELQERRYWDLKDAPAAGRCLSLSEAQEAFHSKIRASVKEHSISDVPIGIFLSGGIDSSTLFALLREIRSREFSVFTMGFEESSFDESKFAEHVAKHFGIKPMLYTFRRSDFINNFFKIGDFLDEPFADMSIFPTYTLSQLSRAHVKVILSGEGADELLMGYPTYIAQRFARLFNALPKNFIHYLKTLVDALPVSFKYFSLDFKLKQFMKGGNESNPVLRNLIWMSAFLDDDKKILFSKEARTDIAFDDAMYDYAMNIVENQGNSFYKKLQYADFFTYLTEDLLVKADRAGMASSLEIRVPYLDHELVGFIRGLPEHFIYQKKILKNVIKPYLPHKITSRSKKGFAIPFANWIRDKKFLTITGDFFDPSYLKKQGLFEYDYVLRLLQEHISYKKDNRKKLGTYMMFQAWYQRWMN